MNNIVFSSNITHFIINHRFTPCSHSKFHFQYCKIMQFSKMLSILILSTLILTHLTSTSQAITVKDAAIAAESVEDFLTVCLTKQLTWLIQILSKLIGLVSEQGEDVDLVHEHRREAHKIISVDAEQALKIVEAETQSANKFVDYAVGALKKVLNKTGDELPLPDKKKQFSQKFLGISIFGRVHFVKGRIGGLMSVGRLGDAMLVEADSPSSLATLAFNIELKDVEVKYAFKISLMDLGPEGSIRGKLNSIKIHMKLNISQSGNIVANEFDVLDTGLFTVHTSGLGPFNFIFSGLGIIIGNMGKRVFLESLEERILHAMNTALRTMPTNSQKRSLIVMSRMMLLRNRKMEGDPSTTPDPPSAESEDEESTESNSKATKTGKSKNSGHDGKTKESKSGQDDSDDEE